MQELSEKIMNDAALKAQADQITGSGEELQQKIRDFAASLGYELEEEMTGKMSLDELDAVSGGSVFSLSKEEADFCGVELLKEDGTPGEYTWYHNYGDYYFRGRKISTSDAKGIYELTRSNCQNCQITDYDEYVRFKATVEEQRRQKRLRYWGLAD